MGNGFLFGGRGLGGLIRGRGRFEWKSAAGSNPWRRAITLGRFEGGAFLTGEGLWVGASCDLLWSGEGEDTLCGWGGRSGIAGKSRVIRRVECGRERGFCGEGGVAFVAWELDGGVCRQGERRKTTSTATSNIGERRKCEEGRVR